MTLPEPLSAKANPRWPHFGEHGNSGVAGTCQRVPFRAIRSMLRRLSQLPCSRVEIRCLAVPSTANNRKKTWLPNFVRTTSVVASIGDKQTTTHQVVPSGCLSGSNRKLVGLQCKKTSMWSNGHIPKPRASHAPFGYCRDPENINTHSPNLESKMNRPAVCSRVVPATCTGFASPNTFPPPVPLLL